LWLANPRQRIGLRRRKPFLACPHGSITRRQDRAGDRRKQASAVNEWRTVVVEADLARTDHQEVVVRLHNAYAMDPMGVAPNA
jgi:hypothetical protein